MPFTCDVCRIEHPDSDLGKNLGVDAGHHEGCTGQLCRRCTWGDTNRATRRQNRAEVLCQTPCR